MKVIHDLIRKWSEKRDREVDEEIDRKRDNFKKELQRLEAIAIEAKVRGRHWDDQRNSNSKPT